jgi:hypothetical protein
MQRLGLLASACLLLALGASVGRQSLAGQVPGQAAPERSLSERYRAFAMREMHKLAFRTCRLIPRRVLFKTFSTVDDPSDNNYTALGYAKRVDISPIPLQRAAYNGCSRGLREGG